MLTRRHEDRLSGRKVGVFQVSDPVFLNGIEACGPAAILNLEPGGGELRQQGRVTRGSFESARQVRNNNAEVLFLHGRSILAARRFRNIGHAARLYVPLNPALAFFLPGFLRYVLRGRLTFDGLHRFPSGRLRFRFWLGYRNTHPKFTRGPRYFVSPFFDAHHIFATLAGVDYCLLRWHRHLGELDRLQDLDLLVTDEGLTELVTRLDQAVGLRPVDVYTVSGHGGHGFSGIAYYPPERARALIAGSRPGPHGARVPEPGQAYLSFCYHLVFHKGLKNPDPGGRLSETTWGARRYYDELRLLADEAGQAPPSTVDDLEGLLKSSGWFPQTDTLGFYARTNPFVEQRYFSAGIDLGAGLTVFVLREAAERYGVVDTIAERVRAAGFHLVASAPIPEPLRPTVAAMTRGGNWSTPRDREDMGGPVHYLIAHDPHPRRLRNRRQRRRYPRVDNLRTLCKTRIRDDLARELGITEFNVLHASDNSLEALEYVAVLAPELQGRCRDLIGAG